MMIRCRVCGVGGVSICEACAMLEDSAREEKVSLRKLGILDQRTDRYIHFRETSLENWTSRKSEGE